MLWRRSVGLSWMGVTRIQKDLESLVYVMTMEILF
jgi:hypothetical protein